MVRKGRTQPHPKHDDWSRLGWFGSSNESVEGVQDWDVKSQTFAEAVLGVLGTGRAIMFGVSMDGGAVSITIFDGDAKSRKWVTDSIEFDDALSAVWQKTHQRPTTLHIPGTEASAD